MTPSAADLKAAMRAVKKEARCNRGLIEGVARSMARERALEATGQSVTQQLAKHGTIQMLSVASYWQRQPE